MNVANIFRLLDLTLYAVERGLVVQEQIGAIRDKTMQLVNENRNPTSEEWAALVEQLGVGEDELDAIAEKARENKIAAARAAAAED